MVDKAEYVLGIDPDGKREPERLAVRASLFREQVAACAERTGDLAACAVRSALVRLANGEPFDLPGDCASNDLFAFAYELDDTPVHEREAVRSYWKELQRTTNQAESADLPVCLVTGKNAKPGTGMPLVKNVPGGSSSGVALVSFNSTAFESYGWRKAANAAVSEQAGILAITALNRLLHPRPPDPSNPTRELPRRNLRLSADTTVCYWSRDNGMANMLGPLLAVDEESAQSSPDVIGKLYESVWKGRPFAVEHPEAFYTLVISGAQGRATVRDWIETTTQHAVDSLAQYFTDLKIGRRCRPPEKTGTHPPGFALPLLLEALADPGERRNEKVPSALAAELYHAAIDSRLPFPRTALTRAVARYRAELGSEREKGTAGWKAAAWNDARAAIIKAWLNRQLRSCGSSVALNLNQEAKEDMRTDSNQQGYILGQLMAVLEKLQFEAQGNLNATIVDRYFGGASASPRSVFVNLLKGARSHVRRARSDGNAKKVFHLDRMVDQLCDQFVERGANGKPILDLPGHNGFPSSLSPAEQGQFVLGYHQTRKWLWMSGDERTRWERDHADSARAYLWTKEPGNETQPNSADNATH